jgi:hypothetical protein
MRIARAAWKSIVDLYRCAVLIVRYRGLQFARVSDYAEVSMLASQVVGRMRLRYPGQDFMWSHVANHVLDSCSEYVLLWHVDPFRRASFIFKGPVWLLRQKVDEGFLDGAVRQGGVLGSPR